MKTWGFIVLLFFSSTCFANCFQEARVSITFMDQYLTYTQTVESGQHKQSVKDWLKSNKLVTPEFVKAYELKERDGLKNDPNVGWDKDIILDAQDSPAHGFELFKCSNTSGFVVLQGIDWPTFKVTVRVAQTKTSLRIVGAGMVNIPERERARQ